MMEAAILKRFQTGFTVSPEIFAAQKLCGFYLRRLVNSEQ